MSAVKKKILDERTFGLIRPESDGHILNSTGCERTSFKFDGVRTDISEIVPNQFGRCLTTADTRQYLFRRLTDIRENILSSSLYLFSFFVSLHLCLSTSLVISSFFLFVLSSLLFHLLFSSFIFSSSLLFASVWRVLCVLCCVAVCCV